MAYVKVSALYDLAGFYKRELGNFLNGIVVRYIPTKDAPFFIVRLIAPCLVEVRSTKGKITTVEAPVGAYVGLGSVASLAPLIEYVGKSYLIRLVFMGKIPSKKHVGKDVVRYDIEVDRGDEEEPAPF